MCLVWRTFTLCFAVNCYSGIVYLCHLTSVEGYGVNICPVVYFDSLEDEFHDDETPRPKYPSDVKNYHELRSPGLAHTIRLPEELLDIYTTLKNALGPQKSHADVVHFLFEAAEPVITAMLQASHQRAVSNSQDTGPSYEAMVDDPDGDIQDPDQDVLDPDNLSSDKKKLLTADYAANSDGDEEDMVCLDAHNVFLVTIEEDELLVLYVDCRFDSSRSGSRFKELLQDKRLNSNEGNVDAATTIAQMAVFNVQQLKEFCRVNGLSLTCTKLALVQRVFVHLKLPEAGGTTEVSRQRPLKYPELAAHDLAYKLKSWIYTCCKNAAARGDTTPQQVTKDIHNAADHWSGDHSVCRTLPGNRRCVTENWGPKKERYNRSCHVSNPDFLKKYLTENKMRFYIRAQENFLSETFHSVINKYATKHIHFDASHTARLACAALDWNENIRREVREVYDRASNNTAVRTNIMLVSRTNVWNTTLARKVFG
ncbi:hypothetical protein R1sor_012783 [Riccia sorocarpa]|uniref:SAP domain-containing protein n=1 Tax=Riccia sorocarpa TaxID=122646 RepID=A0ABD3I7H2_9MARC